MYILCFYVPEKNKEEVKQALFDAGAGKFNNYDCCSWETKGTGQFRPLENSKPHLGTQNSLEKVGEYKVEMVCNKKYLDKIIETLLTAHPYEEVAYHILKHHIVD
jgi:hypothetical protein